MDPGASYLRIKALPFKVTPRDVTTFISTKTNIRLEAGDISLMTQLDEDAGRHWRSGIGYVRLGNAGEVQRARWDIFLKKEDF